MKVLIPCAGMATRWFGDTPKQLLPVLDEPILHRTVRLVREVAPDAQIQVIVPDLDDDRFKVPGTRRAVAKLDPSRSQADKFLSSRHLWAKSDRTVILWGDVFFTRAAIRAIFEFDGSWAMFARLTRSSITGKNHKEPFAWSIAPDAHPVLDAGIDECVREARAGRLLNWSGSWHVYKATIGKLWVKWGDLDPDDLAHVVTIDDATDDFDYESDWDEWCARYYRYTDEQRAQYGMTR